MVCMLICVNNVLPEDSMQEKVTVVLNDMSEDLDVPLEAIMEEDWMYKEISMAGRRVNGIPDVKYYKIFIFKSNIYIYYLNFSKYRNQGVA